MKPLETLFLKSAYLQFFILIRLFSLSLFDLNLELEYSFTAIHLPTVQYTLLETVKVACIGMLDSCLA